MRQRRAVTRVTARDYRKASRKEKGRVLSTLVKQTKLNRVYAGWLLRTWGKKVWLRIDGQLVRVVTGRKTYPSGVPGSAEFGRALLADLARWAACGSQRCPANRRSDDEGPLPVAK